MLHKSASFHIVQIYLLLSNARKKPQIQRITTTSTSVVQVLQKL